MNKRLQAAITLMLGVGMGLTALKGAAQDRRAEADKPKLDEFKILIERNIFDPNRRPNYMPPPPSATPPEQPKIALAGVFLDPSETVAIFEGTRPEYNVAIHQGGILMGYRLSKIHPDKVQLTMDGTKLEMPVAAKLVLNTRNVWELTTDTTPLLGYSSPSSSSSYSSYSSSSSYGGSSSSYGGSSYGRSSSSYGGSSYGGSSDRRSDFGDRRSDWSGSRDGSSSGSSAGSAPSSSGTPGAAPAPSGGSSEDIMRRMMERRQREAGR